MNSFWSTVSPLRFFQSAGPATGNDEYQVPPSAPDFDAMSEAPTPASFAYSGTSFKSIISSFGSESPKSPVEEVLNSNQLSERLRNLQILEAIEDKQREIERKRSLHISQLQATATTGPDIHGVLDELAQSTRLMAFSHRKSIEKESNENSKLKGLETLQIIHFLSSFNKKSVSPAYFQVDVTLRESLAMTLGLPDGSTLETYYGDALGPDVAFIRDLRKLVGQRTDVQPKLILQAFCMKDKNSLDRTALMAMLSACKQAFLTNPDNFDEFSPAECKESVVANIFPISFRKSIETFSSRYMNPAYPFNSLVELIIKEFDLELAAMNRLKIHGVQGIANSVISDTYGLSVTDSVALSVTEEKAKSEKMTCFNCQKKGHSATVCRSPCKIHKKQCADKMVCYRTDKKAKALVKSNLATVSTDVSISAYSSNLIRSNSIVASPRGTEAIEEKIGFIDTGCNALCLTKESQFDSIVKSNNSSIFVADGKSVPIHGSGLICQKPAKLVKNFKKALVPTSTFTDNFFWCD